MGEHCTPFLLPGVWLLHTGVALKLYEGSGKDIRVPSLKPRSSHLRLWVSRSWDRKQSASCSPHTRACRSNSWALSEIPRESLASSATGMFSK